jgi:hypothetical protein
MDTHVATRVRGLLHLVFTKMKFMFVYRPSVIIAAIVGSLKRVTLYRMAVGGAATPRVVLHTRWGIMPVGWGN